MISPAPPAEQRTVRPSEAPMDWRTYNAIQPMAIEIRDSASPAPGGTAPVRSPDGLAHPFDFRLARAGQAVSPLPCCGYCRSGNSILGNDCCLLLAYCVGSAVSTVLTLRVSIRRAFVSHPAKPASGKLTRSCPSIWRFIVHGGFVVHRPSGCAVAYAEDQEVGLSVAEMLERDHADALEALADAKFGKPAKKSGAHLRARKALEPALKRWR
jgi:hypothetical protein